MKRALVALCAVLAVGAAMAAPLHLTQEQCFLATDAGSVNSDTLTNAVELVNLGSTTLWCALVNQSDARVGHSRPILVNGSWAIDGNPQIWCIAATVDQQTSLDGGANGTADGGPSGCTIISRTHP